MKSFLKSKSEFRRAGLSLTMTFSLVFLTTACRLKKSVTEISEDSALTPIPFTKAGEQNDTTLAAVHSVALQTPPAALRPDPDLYARRLLKQFRTDGNTLARQLGQLERYRLMLGGASEDFRTVPQESYDSTSLLTLQKVAREICIALVSPTSWQHPGWNSVLPFPLTDVEKNIRYMMQKMLGIPDSDLSSSAVSDLVEIVNSFPEKGVAAASGYIYACTALAMDAEALLL